MNNCLKRNNFEAINSFLNYMIARQEENALKNSVENKIAQALSFEE